LNNSAINLRCSESSRLIPDCAHLLHADFYEPKATEDVSAVSDGWTESKRYPHEIERSWGTLQSDGECSDCNLGRPDVESASGVTRGLRLGVYDARGEWRREQWGTSHRAREQDSHRGLFDATQDVSLETALATRSDNEDGSEGTYQGQVITDTWRSGIPPKYQYVTSNQKGNSLTWATDNLEDAQANWSKQENLVSSPDDRFAWVDDHGYLGSDHARYGKIKYAENISLKGPSLLSDGQSSWQQNQRSRVRFPGLPDFLRISGSGTGSTQPREYN
jgi:hypothetical protein